MGVLSHVDDVRSLLQARRTTASMRQPAADCIATLVAQEGALPPEAWRVFRRAAALVIRCARDPAGAEILSQLVQLLSEVPARVESLRAIGLLLPRRPSTPLSERLAEAVAASACRSTLRRLDLGADARRSTVFTRQAADLLAAGLPALQSLVLHVHAGAVERWGPATLPPALTSLRLRLAADEYEYPYCALDMAPIAAAGEALVELSIDAWCPAISSAHSLAQLTNLSSVTLTHDWEWEDLFQECLPTVWRALAQLPKLDSLALLSPVTLGPEQLLDVPLPQLQHLTALNLELEIPEEKLSGCLAITLPNIKNMVITEAPSLFRLARALRHHGARPPQHPRPGARAGSLPGQPPVAAGAPLAAASGPAPARARSVCADRPRPAAPAPPAGSLQRLQHVCRSAISPATGPWLQPQLCTVNTLTHLDWQLSYEPAEADAMLAGVSACPALVEMILSDSPGYSLPQLQVRCAGAGAGPALCAEFVAAAAAAAGAARCCWARLVRRAPRDPAAPRAGAGGGRVRRHAAHAAADLPGQQRVQPHGGGGALPRRPHPPHPPQAALHVLLQHAAHRPAEAAQRAARRRGRRAAAAAGAGVCGQQRAAAGHGGWPTAAGPALLLLGAWACL